MDFPGVLTHHPVIATHSREMLGDALAVMGGATGYDFTANLAKYVPINFERPYLIRSFWWANGTSPTNNRDFGLYTVGGARLVSIGSTAATGSDICQVATLGTPYVVTPGRYYLSYVADGGGGDQYQWNFSLSLLRTCGVLEQTSAFPLPSAATMAAASAAGRIPLIGVTSRANGVV